MNERLVHLDDCTPERVWALRWTLFAYPEVCNVTRRSQNQVAVIFDAQPRPDEWLAVAREHGLHLEPLPRRDTERDAA